MHFFFQHTRPPSRVGPPMQFHSLVWCAEVINRFVILEALFSKLVCTSCISFFCSFLHHCNFWVTFPIGSRHSTAIDNRLCTAIPAGANLAPSVQMGEYVGFPSLPRLWLAPTECYFTSRLRKLFFFPRRWPPPITLSSLSHCACHTVITVCTFKYVQ